MPGQLSRDYAQRAEQINAHATEHGYEGQAMRRMSFCATRKPKEKVGLDELRDQWRRRAEPYRDDLDKLQAVARERGEQTIETDPSTARRAALFGIRQSETREAVNNRSEEHTSELQSLMRISYAVFCLKKKKHQKKH